MSENGASSQQGGEGVSPSHIADFGGGETPSPLSTKPILASKRLSLSSLFRPYNAESETRKSDEGFLPHWQQAGATYFVTWRMGDSVSAEQLNQWRSQQEFWLRDHPKPWSPAEWRDYNKLFEGAVQDWLDRGHGSCLLDRPMVRDIVVAALHYFDQQRYVLGDFVVMPNHVHVIFLPLGNWRLDQILHSWKSFTSKQIGKLVSDAPEPFWMSEYFDHLVRSERQLNRYRNYIAQNPVDARLQAGTWSHYAEGPVGCCDDEGKMPSSPC